MASASLPFSAPNPRSLPTSVNQPIETILANWQAQLANLISTTPPKVTPSNFAVSNQRGGMALSWSPVPDGDGYEILKSANGSFTDDLQVLPIKDPSQCSFFDGTGGSATSVSYRIRTTSGTAANPQSQRGPESGPIRHTSIDSTDTVAQPSVRYDVSTTDATRSLARKGNYGSFRLTGLGKSGGIRAGTGGATTAGGGTSGGTTPTAPTSNNTCPWANLTGNLNTSQVIPWIDAGIAYLGTASLAIGNGTEGDASGNLDLATIVASSSVTAGVNATSAGTLVIANGGALGVSVTLQNLGATTAYNFNLPTTAGAAGSALISQGGASTSMTWATVVNSLTGDSLLYSNSSSVNSVTLALNTQTANYVLAGPTSGAAHTPTFRALVAADIPSLSGTYLPLAGGTMTGVLTLEASAAGLKDSAGSAGSSGNILSINGSGYPVWATPATNGTVTSFSAGTLSPLFTTSVATATTTPALTFALSNAAAGTILGNNTGSAAGPAYTAAPVLGLNASVAGTLGLANGGGSGTTITLQNLGNTTAYNFNLPITAGAAGSVLTSQAGGSTSMTWTTQAALAVAWSSLAVASGNLSLANTSYTTTFTQTSGVTWLWENVTAAVLATPQNSPILELAGTYFGAASGSVAASALDGWTIQDILSSPVQLSGTAAITHIAETSGHVVTLTLVGSTFVPGQFVIITGLSAATWINTYVVTLLTGTATTCTFNDPNAGGSSGLPLGSTVLTGTPVMTLIPSSTLSITQIGTQGQPQAIVGTTAGAPATVNVPTLTIACPGQTGTGVYPALSFGFQASQTSQCLLYFETARFNVSTGSNNAVSDFCVSVNNVAVKSSGGYLWSNGPSADTNVAAADTGLWRTLAGCVGIGSGTTSAVNGTLQLTGIINNGGQFAYGQAIQSMFADTTTTVTLVGAGNSVGYTYSVVAVDINGQPIGGATGSNANGPTNLSGTNYNKVTWTAVPGAYAYAIYRTVGGATQGKLTASTAVTEVTNNSTTTIYNASPTISAANMTGQYVTINGCANPANVGTFLCTEGNASSITLLNPNGINESTTPASATMVGGVVAAYLSSSADHLMFNDYGYAADGSTAPSSSANSSGSLGLYSWYENSATGPAYSIDQWNFSSAVTAGLNGTNTMTLKHTGSAGVSVVTVNGVTPILNLQNVGSTTVPTSQLCFITSNATIYWGIGSHQYAGSGTFEIFGGAGTVTNAVQVFAANGSCGIGIGNLTPAVTLSVFNNTASTGATQLLVQGGAATADATTNTLFRVNQGGGTTAIFQILGSGGITTSGVAGVTQTAIAVGTLATTNGIVTTFTGVSDERLKTFIPYKGGLAEILTIQPIRFKYNEEGQKFGGWDGEHIYVGFSAQNVQKAIPEAIQGTEGEERYLSFDDRPVLAALVNATKELSAKNDALEARLARLES